MISFTKGSLVYRWRCLQGPTGSRGLTGLRAGLTMPGTEVRPLQTRLQSGTTVAETGFRRHKIFAGPEPAERSDWSTVPPGGGGGGDPGQVNLDRADETGG